MSFYEQVWVQDAKFWRLVSYIACVLWFQDYSHASQNLFPPIGWDCKCLWQWTIHWISAFKVKLLWGNITQWFKFKLKPLLLIPDPWLEQVLVDGQEKRWYDESSVQFSSVTQSCPTLCDPMNHSTPGLPVHHQLQEFTQTHVHRVSDAIQPSLPLSSPSPPAPNPSQHQSLFQWVNSSHEVAKVLEFQL